MPKPIRKQIADILRHVDDLEIVPKIGVVDATPKHHRTLYFFFSGCKAYHVAPHVAFDPPAAAVETLADVFQRVTDQDPYLKRPASVLE